jgi:hypothetical protein
MNNYHDVEHPIAYERRVQANIRANYRQTNEGKWLAAVADRKELIDWLQSQYNGQRPEAFLTKVFDGYLNWGGLTPGQEAAVRKIKAEAVAKKAEYAAKRAIEAEKAEFVGEVGQRLTFDVTVTAVPTYETQYGTLYINLLKQGDDVIVYKGSRQLAEKGERVTFKATVKAHDVRQGVKQTIVARPANIELVEEEEEDEYFDGENVYGLPGIAQSIAEDRLGQRFEDIGDSESALEGDVD